MFEEERVFDEISPDRIKEQVVQAAKLTKKYGLTAYTVAAWGKLTFKGDTMGVAVGRIAASKGGVSGEVHVTQAGEGSKVRLAWEKDNEKCREVTVLFWKNLEAVLKPAGFQLGPRSTALKVGTGLILCLTVYLLAAVIIWLSAFMELDLLDPLKGLALAGVILNFGLFVITTLASVNALRRRSWQHVLAFTSVLAAFFALSLLALLWEDLVELVSPAELVVRFVAAIVCCIIFSRTKEQFA